jgi:hypothetical protein
MFQSHLRTVAARWVEEPEPHLCAGSSRSSFHYDIGAGTGGAGNCCPARIREGLGDVLNQIETGNWREGPVN